MAIDRLRSSPARDRIPPRCAAITPVWLTWALQARFPGVLVRALEPLEASAGTTDRARFHVTYEGNGPRVAAPASVFVKTAPADLKTRLFANLMHLGATETRFYGRVSAQLPIDTPRAIHAHADATSQRFVLVLEDLSARGVRFGDPHAATALDDARSVVAALARLHAALWESPRLRSDLVWLKSRDHNPNYRVERALCAAAITPALRKLGDIVPSEIRCAVPRILALRDGLEDAWARPPVTLVHGDAHAGNVYFHAGHAGFIDWQVVQRGQGMRDVTYFLVNSLPTDLRRAHERELLELYLACLARLGVRAPDLDVVWSQYRLHAIYAWIAATVTAAAATLQPEAIVFGAAARACAALIDLGSIAALDDLARQ